MGAGKRFFQELMLLSPIVLLMAVGVGTRTHVDTFEQVAYPDWMHQRVAQFAGPMRDFESLLENGPLIKQPDGVRKLAHRWVGLVRAGKLLPLTEVNDFDSMREGVKSQVGIAIQSLSVTLSEIGTSELEQGEFKSAALDATLGLELSQTGKYYDLYSVGLLSMRQRRLLDVLSDALPKIDAETVGLLEKRLRTVRDSDCSITGLVVHARRLWGAEKARQGERVTAIQEVDRVVDVVNLIHESAEKMEISRALKELTLVYSGPGMPPYLPETRFAWTTQESQMAEFDSLLAKLSTRITAR